MNNFQQRSLTGILFVSLVVGSIFFHAYAFFAVTLLVSTLAMNELANLFKEKYSAINKPIAISIGFSFQIILFLAVHHFIDIRYLVLLLPLLWSPFIYHLFKGGDNPIKQIALTLMVPMYVAFPLSFLYLLGHVCGDYQSSLLIGYFCMVWCNDTGAYLVGVSIGKHKLYERISPKKTWEGFIGGILFTFVAAFFVYRFTGIGSMYVWMISGLVVALFGTLGDLVESMLKRDVNIKDSGSILPGHGGILDRFDAVIFSAPIVYTIFVLLAN